MEAMILAAGGGTRLKPLTDRIPKALVEVGGRPMLDHVLSRLIDAGVNRVVVNTHHHQDQIQAYLGSHTPPGVSVAFSPEPGGPFDTGGGLFNAAPHFREREPFLLHNVDVLSDIDFETLMAGHLEARTREGEKVLATLAVQEREAQRSLVFDDLGLLGWENQGSDRAPDGSRRVRDPVGRQRRMAFTGIHVVEPTIFSLGSRSGTFSIISLYLDLAAEGWIIRPQDVTGADWLDVGTPERLAEARRRFG